MTGIRNVTVLSWLLLASIAGFASPSKPQGVTVTIDDARSPPHAAKATGREHIEWEEIENELKLSKEDKIRIERGLALSSKDPGEVDGTFDLEFRKALAAWQPRLGIAATGYLNQESVDGLLEKYRLAEVQEYQDARRLGGRMDALQVLHDYDRYLQRWPLGYHREEAMLARERDVVGKRFRDCAQCPEMLVVPAGSFLMGSKPSERGRSKNEGPRHRVEIAEAYAVGVYEVTFAEWDACVDDGGCGGYRPDDEGWGRGRQPVINVSWMDAAAYVQWLSWRTARDYRLLSEAQWEHSARKWRSGSVYPFYFGKWITTDQANYDGLFSFFGYSRGRMQRRERAVEVGSFPPSGFGLHDMHGNVWEWTADCWKNSYEGTPSDGSAWTKEGASCKRRVARGGAWYTYAVELRTANRTAGAADMRNSALGFRVARTL